MPQIEHKIEERLLLDYASKITDETERSEVIMAYQQRRVNIAKLQEEDAYAYPTEEDYEPKMHITRY